MKNLVFILFLVPIIALQCKPDAQKDPLAALETKLAEDPTPAKANDFIKEINKRISENKDGDNSALIEKGLAISKKHNLKNRTAGFLTMALRNGNTSLDKKTCIYELATIMEANRMEKTSNTLFKAYADLYPNDSKTESILAKINPIVGDNIHPYMLKTAESIFENPDQYGINRKSSSEYVNACEAYAMTYNDEKAPEYLYKAAEIARSLRTFPKTLSLYDWIIESYPNYEKTATTLFLKGFVIENELKNEALARSTYESFLDKYPSHELADDVKFLLDNLGKTNEEILEIIESKKQNQPEQ